MKTDTILHKSRRWLFRGLCFAILALCVTAWVGSYWRWGEWVESDGRHLRVMHVGAGTTYVFAGEEHRPSERAWRGGPISEKDFDYVTALFHGTKYHLSGFALDGDASVGVFNHMWFVGVPLWFPSALSALLFWVVWRQTRWLKSERGFAVVAARGW